MYTPLGNIRKRIQRTVKSLYAPEIPAAYKAEFFRQISFQNLQRHDSLLIPVTLFFLFLIAKDLRVFIEGSWIANDRIEAWFYMEVAFVGVTTFFLGLSRYKRATSPAEILPFHTALIMSFKAFLLLWGMLGTLIPLKGNIEITSYILVVFVVTTTLIVKTSTRFFLYSTFHVLYIAGLYHTHTGGLMLEAHVNYSIVAIIVSWGLGHLVNVVYIRKFLHQKTIEQQSIQLQQANSQLSSLNYQLGESLEESTILLERLRESNRNLEILNEEKNEFLGIAAHDMKNPIGGILLNAEVIKSYYDLLDKESVLKNIAIIESMAVRMNLIISNLLDINAIESGAYNITIDEVEIQNILAKILPEYEQKAAAKELRLVTDITPATIFADTTAMTEVLENLISNAIKYSPAGKKISISSHLRENSCRIEIQDEGPGLTETDKTRLFKKFAKLSAKPTAGESSTGLGLSISKRLIEAMNGQIFCQSEAGNGATFILEIPLASQSVPAVLKTADV